MANSFLNKIITREKKKESISSQKEKPLLKHERVGAFQKLPMVTSAQRKARNVTPTKGITNIAKRERNRAAKQLDALMKVLGRVDTLRKKLLSVGKQHVSLCAQKLRSMPMVDSETPTLCLVGAPNVGKSSVVRILSTGKPEVCNYPFTTRGILMGHIVLNYQRFQVTDTPGLLTRHDDDRNDLERLTLAVLTHLPTAVLYVHDLTGECGTSPDDKFITYNEIKERFSGHLGSKLFLRVIYCKILQAIVADDGVGRCKKFGPDGAIRVSVKSEVGITELKGMVHDLLQPQMAKITEEDNKQAG